MTTGIVTGGAVWVTGTTLVVSDCLVIVDVTVDTVERVKVEVSVEAVSVIGTVLTLLAVDITVLVAVFRLVSSKALGGFQGSEVGMPGRVGRDPQNIGTYLGSMSSRSLL